MKKKIVILCTLICITLLNACTSKEKYGLDADKPVTLTLWHYYNGSQKESFDNLVEEFNETEGKKYGIVIDAVAKGSIMNIADELKNSLDKKIDAPQLPNIFAAYTDTAEEMEKANQLVTLNDYMSSEDMKEYVDDYMEDGVLHEGESVKLFPIAKATEVLVINKNAWEDFQKATSADIKDFETWEGLVRLSEKYYNYSKGQAFFGRDAIMNYLNVGSVQLGSELFTVTKGTAKFTVDKSVMKTLWDNYYLPYVKGYFIKNGKFASDDMKTQDIIASLSSSASATFYPKEIINKEGKLQSVEYMVLPVPNFEGKKPYAITQGAGMAISKSDETKEYASIVFLKWFTEAKRNTVFSAGSSYLPVKKEANDIEFWEKTVAEKNVDVSPLLKNTIKTSIHTVNTSALYSQKQFTNSYEIRNYLESTLIEKAKKDQEAVRQAIKDGKSREDALRPYIRDDNFDNWFEEISEGVARIEDSAK